MKNEFVVMGSSVIIFLRRRNGDLFTTKISISNLARAQEFPATWCLLKVPRKERPHYYAVGKLYDKRHRRPGGGGGKNIYLHRWILDLKDSTPWVNHKDWDGLNNVDENIEITSLEENRQHRRLGSTLPATNTSGLLDVRSTGSGWIVYVAGEYIGTFKTAKKAKHAAARARDRINIDRLRKVYERGPKKS